jgi:hypothetical protein
MHVDRTRFLALTFSMAGAGCNTPPPPAAPAVVDITPTATVTATATATATAEVHDAAAPVPSAHPSTEGVLASPGEGDEGWGDAGGVCDTENAKGTPGDCSGLRAPGPSCESFADTKSDCGAMRTKFRPRVAERIVNCVMGRSGSQAVCDFELMSKCVSNSLRVSCTDQSTLTQCRAIVSQCKQNWPSSERGVRILTTTECQALLASVAPRNKGKMVTCMAEGCNAGGCYYDL